MAKQITGSNEEILIDIQKPLLKYAYNLGLALKLEMQTHSWRDHNWYPDPNELGVWRNKDISIFFRFSPNIMVRERRRKLGQIRPIGEPKQKTTLCGQFDNSHSNIPLHETVNVTKGVATEVKRINTTAYNYEFKTTIEGTVGTETNNVKVGFESSFGGSIENSTEDLISRNDTVSFDSQFTIPAGTQARILTDVTETDVEIDVVDTVLLDTSLSIFVYKKHENKSYVKDNPDIIGEKVNGKWYRRAFYAKSIDDLSMSLRGKNRRYPNIPKNHFENWKHAPALYGQKVNMQDIHKRFTDKKHWEYEIHATLERKDSLFGETTLSTGNRPRVERQSDG